MNRNNNGHDDDRVPNAGQGVSDETEPAEEYEFDQLTDERDDSAGESVADQFGEPDDNAGASR